MNEQDSTDLTRRDFIKGGSFATLMTMLGGVELISPTAQGADVDKLVAYTVKCGVIGLGTWGREIVNTLVRQKEAELVAVCDKYPPFLKRGAALAPKAQAVEDYKELLANKDIQAVFIATPTHQHRQIVIDALAAGKHVYCEAPLAHTVEDARAIAVAAKAAGKQYFQAGLNLRSDAHRQFLLTFVRSGAAGKPIKARAQWHKKQSWRMASPNPEREKEINWRLSQATSAGLIGEIGIHQIDVVNWYHNARPVAVTGFGGIHNWNDGRDVADTAQALFEYPGGAVLNYEVSLANSFDSSYEMFYGLDAAIMLRGSKAWLFKEVDAAMLGWEVYAQKDMFGDETGIALIANATRSSKAQAKPGEDAAFTNTPLAAAFEAFLFNANEIGTAVEDFAASFDINDKKALAANLAKLKLLHAAGYKEGYESTVVALKANDAVNQKTKITFDPAWFELA